MPRAKAAAHLSGLIGSDSEPDFDDFEAMGVSVPRQSEKQMPPAKKPRGRPAAANKVTKPSPKPTRRTTGRVVAAAQAQERTALADKSNTTNTQALGSDEATNAKSIPVVKAQTRSTRGRPRVVKAEPAAPDSDANNAAPGARRGRPPAVKSSDRLPSEVPETQFAQQMELDGEPESPTGTADTLHVTSDPPNFDVPGAEESDFSIRRRLGELTRKYENLERRHRDLREIGVNEAERLYERLKVQAAENDAASSKLVAKLKEDMAAQSKLLKQSESKQQLLDRSEVRVAELEEQVADLTTALTNARSEIKTLSMRLAASRTAEAHAKAPGSAIKTSANGSRMAPSEAVQTALAKEDMYGDLTGLIIRAVKREEQEDVFDCIQTGRNGTLHFKLVLERPDASGDYDAANVTYQPQLDPARDEEMMDMLPDYLIDEIAFKRPHASKFYTRVINALNERLD
ncbi:Monopolin complex subunit pcs1 [Paramyrothecium foliicola]|nr:Monopolin complex subunit pcs1 [Paramyrothecium foliicola]